MAALLRQQARTGHCDTGLPGKTAIYLRGLCDRLEIPVTGTGIIGNKIKPDLVAALWVHAMDFRDVDNEHHNTIRRFVSWLVKKKVPEITDIAETHFALDITSGKKGQICEKILQVLLQDPEVPIIPGFNDEGSQDGSDEGSQGGSEEGSQDRSVEATPEPEEHNQAALAALAAFTALTGNHTVSPQEGFQDATKLFGFVERLTSNGIPADRALSFAETLFKPSTQPTAAQGPVTKPPKHPTPETPVVQPTTNTSATYQNLAKSVRDIARAMRNDPSNAHHLAPALEEVADKIHKE